MRTDFEVLEAEVKAVANNYWNLDYEKEDEFLEDPYAVDLLGKIIYLRTHCKPEDAVWCRDLQDNFYVGLNLGVRIAMLALKDNPELFKELQDVSITRK